MEYSKEALKYSLILKKKYNKKVPKARLFFRNIIFMKENPGEGFPLLPFIKGKIHLSCAFLTPRSFVLCGGRPRLCLWKPQTFEKFDKTKNRKTKKCRKLGTFFMFYSNYFAVIYPFLARYSAIRTPPPAAPRRVLCERPTNL